jgi:DNA-binding transcriptional regulator YdaS (Cro superfamily)
MRFYALHWKLPRIISSRRQLAAVRVPVSGRCHAAGNVNDDPHGHVVVEEIRVCVTWIYVDRLANLSTNLLS